MESHNNNKTLKYGNFGWHGRLRLLSVKITRSQTHKLKWISLSRERACASVVTSAERKFPNETKIFVRTQWWHRITYEREHASHSPELTVQNVCAKRKKQLIDHHFTTNLIRMRKFSQMKRRRRLGRTRMRRRRGRKRGGGEDENKKKMPWRITKLDSLECVCEWIRYVSAHSMDEIEMSVAKINARNSARTQRFNRQQNYLSEMAKWK